MKIAPNAILIDSRLFSIPIKFNHLSQIIRLSEIDYFQWKRRTTMESIDRMIQISSKYEN